jgi:hypothetical protein
LIRNFFAGINEEHDHTFIAGRQFFLKLFFLQSVSLTHEPFDPVTVNCLFKISTTYGEACLQGFTRWLYNKQRSDGISCNGFAFAKQLADQFAALEPFILL